MSDKEYRRRLATYYVKLQKQLERGTEFLRFESELELKLYELFARQRFAEATINAKAKKSAA